MRFEVSRFLKPANVTIGIMLLMGAVSSGGFAMGSSHNNGHMDIQVPASFGDLEGYVAPGDSEALPTGFLRIYSTKDIQSVAGLPEAVQAQAALVRKLDPLSLQSGIQDATGAAAQLGVTPSDFDRVAYSSAGKRAKSNRILAVESKNGSRAFFVARIAADQPDGAVSGIFHCVEQAQLPVAYRATYLGKIAPSTLIEIKEEICQKPKM